MQRTTLPPMKGGFKRRLRQTSGVIDLASIMVGVIIVGVLSTGIVATTFALVPFSQDAAAEQALDSVKTAEGAAYVSGQPNRYLNMDGLVAGDWIQASSRVGVETDADGTCFAAMSHSETGNQFWTDNTTAEILPYVDGTSTSPCADLAAMSGSLTSANPASPGGAVVASPASVTTVAAGTKHSLALDADGNLLTWGNDDRGQLGNGATGNVAVPTEAVADQTFTQITSGFYHSLALDAAGNLWTWGYDSKGQLGNGSTSAGYVTVPTKVAADQTFTQIAAGYHHSMALDAAGNLWTWGDNAQGQLGNGSTAGYVTVPTKVAAGQTFTQITAGYIHSMALDAAGNLLTWGQDYYGQLGNGNTFTADVTVPTKVAAGQTFTQITAGTSHSLALDADGNLWTWGDDNVGQLGNGAPTGDVTIPTKVAVAGQTFTHIAAGGYHNLALDAAGNLWTWGQDTANQLGNGSSIVDVLVPTKLDAGQTFTQITAGNVHSLALDADGNLWTWGYDGQNQLGNGATTTGDVIVPTEVAWK